MKRVYSFITVLPVLYLVVTALFLRDQVAHVYIASFLLIASVALYQYRTKPVSIIRLGQWLASLGSIGIIASFVLSIEKINLLADPGHIASCTVSPVVACSPIVGSWQSSAFGFPNSFIGLFGYAVILAAGMTILAGATKLHRAWWLTLLSSLALGSVFSAWLFYEGVFEIGKLCLYCMLVWLTTFSMFWLVLSHVVKGKMLNLGTQLNKLLVMKSELIFVTVAILFVLLFYRWSDYWLSLI